MHNEDRLPLTSTIEAEVRSAFAVPYREGGMGRSALLAALEKIAPTEQTLEDALAAAGFMPSSADDTPILRWIDATFNHWQTRYPLDDALRKPLAHIRPLAAAFALSDDRFFIPGGHGLHRLLDAIHNGLNGWQASLGGSSQNALEGVRDAVHRASRDFPSEPQVDNTLAAFQQKLRSHKAQLQQLDQVLLEREAATLVDDRARLKTAIAINQLLSAHQVPGSVARFLKSDWLESGIIIARRHGFDSDAWRNYNRTSQLLIDAVQPVAENDLDGQQRLQQTMQQLPHTLSRQLESLQPDSDAVAGAVGLIEYALLRNMRGEDLGLLYAEPIQARGLPESGPPSDEELVEAGIQAGHWYLVDSTDGPRRVRLVGSLVSNLYLLFMDFTGARASRKPSVEFRALLSSGEARSVDVADSFCRAMVEAADMQATEQRAVMAKDMAEREAREAEERLGLERQQHQAALAREEAVAQERAAQANNDASPAERYSGGEQHNGAKQAAQDLQYENSPQPVNNNLHESAAQTAPHRSHAPQAEKDYRSAEQHKSVLNTAEGGRMPAGESPYESNTIVKLQIPMGTWIGFHDRDPPLMARVAVRDLEKDSYIFTNREGIKLRELTVAQLIALIDRDMVDILERKTNFRETVNAMRQEQQERLN